MFSCHIAVVLQLAVLLTDIRDIFAQCHNDCNKHGICNTHGLCDCLSGWEGNDCARRSCPVGPQISQEPNGTDIAHDNAECSGRGVCNYSSGICDCYPGYHGNNCAKLACMNDCNGHGSCISLRQAAVLNDGYLFNRTTVYNQWDSDVIHGCKCDPGYEGADCSLRSCPNGVDPRLSNYLYETVTLVCNCSSSTCSGKFKLQFYGQPTRYWLTSNSKAYEVSGALMTAPNVPTNIEAHTSTPLFSYLNNGSQYNKICSEGDVSYTTIDFSRVAGDLPAISFYANVFSAGSLYFQVRMLCLLLSYIYFSSFSNILLILYPCMHAVSTIE